MQQKRQKAGKRDLGQYRDNGTENGNYYLGFRLLGVRGSGEDISFRVKVIRTNRVYAS